jgi:hypothetical protein
MVMKGKYLIIILTFTSCIFIAGCTQYSTQTPVGSTSAITTSITTATVTPLSTPTNSLVPGPTDIVPDYESVSVTVNHNTISENPIITATYNGGLGLGMTERMDITVIRSDGIQEKGYVDNPQMGAAVTLMGTTKTDRVIVWVTMTSGMSYKIIDRDYPISPHM